MLHSRCHRSHALTPASLSFIALEGMPEIEPGDAVFFHMLALHGSAGVSGSNRRRVLSVRFIGDDIRHAPRRWKTSPHFPGLAESLPAGAEMAHPLFPIVWPA